MSRPKLEQAQLGGHVQALKPGTTQAKAYDGATSLDAALAATTKIIRVMLTEDGFFKLAAGATTSDIPMAAWVPEYFRVSGGETISAIKSSTAGTIYVTEMR